MHLEAYTTVEEVNTYSQICMMHGLKLTLGDVSKLVSLSIFMYLLLTFSLSGV